MQKTIAAETLRKSISVLERRQIEEGKILREQFTVTFESLKPINMIRKMIGDIAEPSELKDNLLQTITGLISGYISRKMLVRSSKNPLLRFTGIIVQYAVTNFVSRNSDSIKALGLYYFNKLSKNTIDHKK
jgi:hypothetical protein